jgi:hypothetical protein
MGGVRRIYLPNVPDYDKLTYWPRLCIYLEYGMQWPVNGGELYYVCLEPDLLHPKTWNHC